MTNNYFRDYRTLGVEPDCTWKELQTAYRRLVQATHPDRFAVENQDKELALERFKSINHAFHNLSNFRKLHGVLPDSAELAASISATIESPSSSRSPDNITGNDSPDSSQEPSTSESTHLRVVLLWGGIAVVTILLLGEEYWTTATEESPTQNTSEALVSLTETLAPIGMSRNSKAAVPVQDEVFTIGSSMGKVYEIQGVPTTTEAGLWHYGSSKVYFSKGVVASWDQAPSHPLKADLSMNSRKSIATSFTVGSPKADVRSAMGTPLFESENIWDYGNSKIYFHNGKVTGWDNSSLRPLKILR